MMPTDDARANNNNEPPHKMRGATQALHDILGDLRMANADAASDKKNNADIEASLGDVITRLDERAFGLLLLLLALPCCLPFVYLLPQIVALPMLALAGQMAAGRHHPWLPNALNKRRFSIGEFEKVVARGEKYIGWFEKLSRPRLGLLTNHTGARIVGAILLIPTASILVPLPSTNTIPGIGVAIASIGLIERDGVLVIIGLIIGLLWVALLATLGFEAASIIRAWFEARA
ncbi:MAG: exopolysaccharide biosynthesis protein [Marinicaulis sp.]|nr:exopolysaccharide biosynthesis protein [Marinicaulis sp.]